MMSGVCGIFFPKLGTYCKHVDESGCNLHEDHQGDHRFTDTKGRLVAWEDDLSCDCGCNQDEDSQPCVLYRDITNSTLVKPELKDGYVSSPKVLLAYLKEVCELRQVGKSWRTTADKTPDYYLVVPGQAWEVRVHPSQAQALETLNLVSIDSSSGDEIWNSTIDLSLPAVEFEINSG